MEFLEECDCLPLGNRNYVDRDLQMSEKTLKRLEEFNRTVIGDYRCEVYSICPDAQKLNKLRRKEIFNEEFEDLENQDYELCSTGGFNCLQRNELGALQGIIRKI